MSTWCEDLSTWSLKHHVTASRQSSFPGLDHNCEQILRTWDCLGLAGPRRQQGFGPAVLPSCAVTTPPNRCPATETMALSGIHREVPQEHDHSRRSIWKLPLSRGRSHVPDWKATDSQIWHLPGSLAIPDLHRNLPQHVRQEARADAAKMQSCEASPQNFSSSELVNPKRWCLMMKSQWSMYQATFLLHDSWKNKPQILKQSCHYPIASQRIYPIILHIMCMQ